MGKEESADERAARALEWLREIEESAAELVESAIYYLREGSRAIRRCCHAISSTRG